MSTLDKAEMKKLSLYRISPGIAGWLSELFAGPVAVFVGIGALGLALGLPPERAATFAGIPAALNLGANVTFLLSVLCERRISHVDVLYLRNYSRPPLFGRGPAAPSPARIRRRARLARHRFLRDIGALQLLVKGILRPPYDTVSFFPPARSDAERREDARIRLKRGIQHVFTVRTEDDETWQTAVEHFMTSCRLVIVECFRIEGAFAWELRRIPEIVDAGKIILVGSEEDQGYAREVERLLCDGYTAKGGAARPLIPTILLHGSVEPFKDRLLAAARERAPCSDEEVQRRAWPILFESLLKGLTMLLTLSWWVACCVAVVWIVVQALWP